MSNKAIRFNEGKLRLDLLPVYPIRDTAAVFTFGAQKYLPRNWEAGFPWTSVYASLQRHLMAWYSGEDFDPESGLSHLAHAACNLMMLQEFEYTKPLLDDRIKSLQPIRKKDDA
jgi:hypothetical protein